MTNAEKFLLQVAAMRNAQKAFFRNREPEQREHLKQNAIVLEKIVDAAILTDTQGLFALNMDEPNK